MNSKNIFACSKEEKASKSPAFVIMKPFTIKVLGTHIGLSRSRLASWTGPPGRHVFAANQSHTVMCPWWATELHTWPAVDSLICLIAQLDTSRKKAFQLRHWITIPIQLTTFLKTNNKYWPISQIPNQVSSISLQLSAPFCTYFTALKRETASFSKQNSNFPRKIRWSEETSLQFAILYEIARRQCNKLK